MAIQFRNLSKRFGAVQAVDDLSFEVPDGSVTGFVGPNGAGKTTAMRALLGLVRADSGTGLVDGRRYVDLAAPARSVGAVLDGTHAHPGRCARDHLRTLARAADLSDVRVDEVLEAVGLTGAARRRVGGFSLGMRGRLGLAAALLGDPANLVLDEPANGLDPAGVRWLRDLLRAEAARGRAVLVSSHLLAELSLTVDRLVLVDRGRLVRAGTLAELGATDAAGLEAMFLSATDHPTDHPEDPR